MASDNFTRANENPIAGNWTALSTTGQFAPGQLISDSVEGTIVGRESDYYWNAESPSDDQFSEVTIGAIVVANEPAVGVILRASPGQGYVLAVQAHAGYFDWTIEKAIGGVLSVIADGTVTGPTLASGDVIQGAVQGTLLSLLRNGVFVGGASDASIASGSYGFDVLPFVSTSDISIVSWNGGSSAGLSPEIQQTIISQYANSPTILALINSFNAAVEADTDIDNFYDWIWDVQTAQGFGLDIWGRIVGVNRTIQTSPPTVLTDSQFRELILLKALANISIATSPSINTVLIDWMTGRGKTYVNDLGQMEIRYMFEFLLAAFEVIIITQSGIFLRPAGVGGWMVNFVPPVFGFKEMGTSWAAPFNQEPFMPAGNPYAVS